MTRVGWLLVELDGARVLVTGGSGGIGSALARAYAAAGAKVVVSARSGGKLADLADEIGGAFHVADLADTAVVEYLVEEVEAAHGPVDVLASNAGIETVDPVATIDPETVRTAARINLEAPMVLTRKVLPGMLERGRGHLVFTSSLAGTAGFPGMGPYCATKAGLNNFVSVLRIELKDTPIRTTLVAPGPVDTRMWDAVVEASPSVQRTVRRLGLLRLLPVLSPERLAARVVAATRVGRRHVRHPRRLALNFLLGEAPRRITEATLAGVRIDPLDRSA